MNPNRFSCLFLSAMTVALCLAGSAAAQTTFRYGSSTVIINQASILADEYDELSGIAVDTSGNLYIAGCGQVGVSFAGAEVCKETLQSNGTYVETVLFSNAVNGLKGVPYVAVDNSGNVYIADTLNSRVLKETLSGGIYTQSVVTTAGLLFPNQIAVDSTGNVYITDPNNKRVLKETYSGGVYTQSVIGSGLNEPLGIAVDSAGNVYIGDAGLETVFKETYSGGTYTQSTVVSDATVNWLESVENLAVDGHGNVYITNPTGPGGYNGSEIVVATPAAGGYLISDVGGPLDASSGYPFDPWGITVDANYNVYATNGYFAVTEFSYPPTAFGSVALGSTSTTLTFPFFTPAGWGGTTTGYTVSANATSTDSAGEFVDTGAGTCDTNGSHTYAKGETCTVTVTFSPKYAGLRKGAVNIVDGYGVILGTVYISGTGVGPQVAYNTTTQTNVATGLATPRGVAVDGRGVVYVADPGTSGYYFTETPSGSTYTQAKVGDSTAVIQGVAVDGSGNFYLADSFNKSITAYAFLNGVASGSPQLLAYSAQGNGLNMPEGMATDASGNVYVADTGNNRVVEEMYVSGVTYGVPAGYSQQFVVASGLNAPQAVAADGAGNVYIADTGNNRILLETPAAFGTFTQSVLFNTGLSAPAGVAVDNFGNVYISDTGNKRVLKETFSGGTYTQSVVSLTGLLTPQGLAIDASESLYIADAGSGSVIRLGLGVAPTLTFASTAVGSTSSDSPQTVTLVNVGNAMLTFPIPTTGNNPSISTNFTLNSVGGTACPLLTTSSSSTATLAAGASCTLPVSFSPTTSGTISGSLKVTDNALNVAGTVQTISLNGTATSASAPIAGLSPSTVPFASTPVGTTATAQNITLSNTGSAALTINSVTLGGTNPSDFAISSNNCGSSLAMLSTCTISVTFTPASVASFAAMLSVADNATGSPQSVTLMGTGAVPVAGLSPSTVPFANTPVGTTATAQNITLSNTGGAPLAISSVTLGGTNPGDFAISGNNCGSSLAMSSTCTISVTFTPASATSFTATLSVADNATGSPQSVTLTGTGTAPQASLSPGTIPFASTTVGVTATAQNIALSNPGNAALTITSITLGGANPSDFAISANTCGSSLAMSATCTISVTFTPASAASFAATITVIDNASGSPQSTTLTGTGTAALVPQAVLTPGNVPFSATAVGSTATAQSLTLSNSGNAPLTINSVTLGGANPTDFAISANTCGSSLAASGTCMISVTFTPASAASFTATLSVADNAAGSPQTSTLTGTGTTSVGNFALNGSPQSQTVTGGSTAQFTITGTGIGGSFTNAIALSVSGLPAGTASSFAPASITPGSVGASSVLSIQTPSNYVLSTRPLVLGTKDSSPLLAALLLLPLLGIRRVRRRLAQLPRMTAVLLLAACCGAMALAGCSGGYFGPQPHTYALTVTGQSGTTINTTTVSLTIQ